MTTGASTRRPSTRTVILTAVSVLFGAALGMPLCMMATLALAPFMGFGAANWGIWVAFGFTAVLGIAALVRLSIHKDRPGYRHAVLAGLAIFMAGLGIAGVVDALSTTQHSMLAPTTAVVLDE